MRLVEDVTVVIPTIAPRENELARALESVEVQTIKPVEVIIVEDEDKEGAAKTRDRGLEAVTSEWTAFLDDDDFLYPDHLRLLLRAARKSESDLVYPWFDVFGGKDPFPQWFGQPWDSENPHIFPVTYLVRTEAAKAVGGFSGGWFDVQQGDMGEDYYFITKFVKAGYKITHLPVRTWGWTHHLNNTAGLPDRW